jgi:predicted RNA-binding Zn-ribbon protein involved in translation (DUF1610 family)
MTRDWVALLPWRECSETVRECRLCGATLDAEADACPECGSNRIARYEIR